MSVLGLKVASFEAGQVSHILGQNDSFGSKDNVVPGLMAQESVSKIGKVLFSYLLVNVHHGCQLVGLKSSGHPVGAGDLFVAGISTYDQQPRTSGNLTFSAAFDRPDGGSFYLDLARESHGRDLF